MKQVKILQAGWEAYTGNLSGINFVDGVSVDEVLPEFFVKRLANIMQIVDTEGKNPSSSQDAIDRSVMTTAVVEPMKRGDEEVVVAVEPTLLTREALEAIASKGGIKALREAVKHLDVSAKSINDLIAEALAAQGQTTLKDEGK